MLLFVLNVSRAKEKLNLCYVSKSTFFRINFSRKVFTILFSRLGKIYFTLCHIEETKTVRMKYNPKDSALILTVHIKLRCAMWHGSYTIFNLNLAGERDENWLFCCLIGALVFFYLEKTIFGSIFRLFSLSVLRCIGINY